VLRADSVVRLNTKMVAQGANIPCTLEAEVALAARGVLVLPDFIANAGGVICAAVEYDGGTEAAAFAAIDEKIRTNTRAVLNQVAASGVLPRAAAEHLARTRVESACAPADGSIE
jgi:glutamate dehydrogenase/leucine dehydrogenase